MKRVTSADLATLRAELEQVRALAANANNTKTIAQPGGSQSGNVVSLLGEAQTLNGGSLILHLNYKPPNGHGAKVDGGYSVIDRTNNVAHAGNFNAVLRNIGGLVVAGQIVGGSIGDANVIAATPIVFAVAANGTLTIQFVANGAYVGTLEWLANLTITEN